MENELKKEKSNHQLEKKDLQEELLKNEEDLKLLLRRNGDLEETVEKMRAKQKKLREKLKNQVNVKVNESEADEELKKNLKNSLLQQNLEKMKNISTSLLKQKEEEYQREMRKLKLTMEKVDNANLSQKNKDLLNSLRNKKRVTETPREQPPSEEVEKLKDDLDRLDKENEVLKKNLDLYKDEVENMVGLLGKIEDQVNALEKENDELAEELDTQNKQLDSERESYKDLKEQYLDQIELNNKRNKEIIMLKNQLNRKNEIGSGASGGTPGGDASPKVEMLEAEVLDKNEVINMLKGDIRDKENQKSHLSQKIRDLEVLFRDMERENQELRKLKEIQAGGDSDQDPQTQLYLQIIKQQQGELKKWRASQLTPEEVPKLQIIIQDQHKEILQLKSQLKAEGKSVPEVNQGQLMEVIRKQQAEINRLKTQAMPSTEDLEDPEGKVKQLVEIVKKQQAELNQLRAEEEKNKGNPEKIQQLMKVIKECQDQVAELKRQLAQKNQSARDPELEAKLKQYFQIIKQQKHELDRLRASNDGQVGNPGREEELQGIIDSKNDEIFFLKKKLSEGGGQPRVQSGAPEDIGQYMGIIEGQNRELESLKNELNRLGQENHQLQMMSNKAENPNVKNMMTIIQKQQDEINDLRAKGNEGENANELMGIIKRQQEELNHLRLISARNEKVDDMIARLKEKQNEINQLRMEVAGKETNEGLIQMIKEKQSEINDLKRAKGSNESVERLMQLLKEKQEEVNQMRANRKGQQNNQKLMGMLKEKQEEINQLRMERAKSENSEELKKIIQEKQDEINRLKNQKGRSSDPSHMRKQIELQNEINRLKPFEHRSKQLDEIVNDLEQKVFELQTANPQIAESQRLGDIIKRQQEELLRLRSQLGGRDWARENEQLAGEVQNLRGDNERLKLNLKEIQEVNKSNKEIYLHEKETLIKEIHTLKKEVQIREERIVETRFEGSQRTEELEAEVRELSQMVNQIMSNAGGEYEEKYREQKAINSNWRQKAEDYDNLKQLYEQKLLENEAKIIKLNNLELKMFVLLGQLRTVDPNYVPVGGETEVQSKPNLYQAPNRFQKRTVSPHVQSGYRKSSPAYPNHQPPYSGPRGSNPLTKRVTRDSYRNQSPSMSTRSTTFYCLHL